MDGGWRMAGNDWAAGGSGLSNVFGGFLPWLRAFFDE